MKPVKVHIDWKNILEGESTSEARNVRRVLQDYVSRDTEFSSEEELRKAFGIPEDEVCVDGGCHEKSCPLVLVEVERGHCDAGLKQLEKGVDFFEGHGHSVRETVLIARSLKRLRKEYTIDDGGYLITRNTGMRVRIHQAQVRFRKKM